MIKISQIFKKSDEKDDEIRTIVSFKWQKTTLITLIGSLSFSFIYACFATIDEVISSKGELQTIGSERLIKSPTTGIIKTILIEENQLVEKGQPLIVFDNKILVSKRESIQDRLIKLNKSLEIDEQLLKIIKNGVDSGAIAKIEYLKNKQNLIEKRLEISNFEYELKKIDHEISNSVLISPLKGEIFNLLPISEGYASSFGEVLFTLVPLKSLEGKVFVENNDIGFIHEGMKAEIRIDAYPFTQFGSINGSLKYIGSESLPPNQQYPFPTFPAYISLDQQTLSKEGEIYQLRPGQTITINFLVRKKPLISLLTDLSEKVWDSLRNIRS